ARGATDDRRSGCLERLHRLERLLAIDEARVERPVSRERSEGDASALERGAHAIELLEPLLDVRERALNRVCVELLAVGAVRVCVRVRKPPGERGVGTRDREREY